MTANRHRRYWRMCICILLCLTSCAGTPLYLTEFTLRNPIDKTFLLWGHVENLLLHFNVTSNFTMHYADGSKFLAFDDGSE